MTDTPIETAQDSDAATEKGDRIAKWMSRAGICSRREAERWIAEGRVKVDGVVIDTPGIQVDKAARIEVDGKVLAEPEAARLWRYHKPAGLVTSNKDEQDRPTVFDKMPPHLPRVMSVGRLDLNSEGLLLMTNDGTLAGKLEHPSTGWVRTYRVRVFGLIDETRLAGLKDGIKVDGIHYASIDAEVESKTGRNAWLKVSLTEGKNREIRRVMEHIGLRVNRLIRIAYGPYQLGNLSRGEVREVAHKQMLDQLGSLLGEKAAKTATRKGWAKAKPKPNAKPRTPRKPKSDLDAKPLSKSRHTRPKTKPDAKPRKP